jgi:hypothetical protein
MGRAAKKSRAISQVSLDEEEGHSTAGICDTRSDDIGVCNALRAWYLHLAHLVASIALMVGIIRIDGHGFLVGSGRSLLTYHSQLYQAQVTGLVSLFLLIIRLIAAACSALLCWRIVYILLEKRGISLAELTHLMNWGIPILPGIRTKTSLRWSLWATATILLIWPQSFASPLATSSIAWIPELQVLRNSTFTSVQNVGKYANWLAMLYGDARIVTAVGAAAMTAKDPTYAFHSSQIPLRRYFNVSQAVPGGSEINITVPYFAVDLSWIDASSDNNSQNVGSSEYQDVDNDFGIRTVGALGIVRSTPWDAYSALPSSPLTFMGTKLVGVKLRTMNFGDQLPDGSVANANSSCPTFSEVFGQLPPVNQHQISIVDGNDTVAYDCYIMAKATIVAGAYPAANCIVAPSDGTEERYATCSTQRDDRVIQDDWLTGLSLDFMSEVLKYTVSQNYSQPWISADLDDYTSGMLTVGYQAAWSGLMKILGNETELVAFYPSQQVVSASIDRWKIYIWLAMNMMLTISAILVFVAQSLSKTKTIRDTAIAAITMNMSDVVHSSRASGLCNMVALGKPDKNLPRLKWKDDGVTGLTTAKPCCRTVVFVDQTAATLKPTVVFVDHTAATLKPTRAITL